MPKAGTTWLARCLAEHPEIHVEAKELAFFTRHFHRGYRWYEEHFTGKGKRLTGEFTPSYFITPRDSPWRKEFYPKLNPRRELTFWQRRPSARDELKARYPGIKVFALLRDPSTRAWSYYWHWHRRKARHQKRVVPFEQMFSDDGRWIRSTGYYDVHLAHWRECFPDFGVFLLDEVKADQVAFLKRVFAFLGVDDQFTPSLASAPNPGAYAPLPPVTRQMLVAEYAPHIDRLEQLLGRDLDAWRRG